MAKTDLTAEFVREILNYEPDTGEFFWRVKKHGRRVSGPAGRKLEGRYTLLTINYKKYPAQRLAWLITYGVWPKEFVDHINGDKADNRLCNLREATNYENNQNRSACCTNNISGYLGVSKKTCKTPTWMARIRVVGKLMYIGSYSSPELAHQAYLEAKRIHHPFGTI